MHAATARSRLEGLRTPRGSEQRILELGFMRLRVEGMDPPLARSLTRRWGRWFTPDSGGPVERTVEVVEGRRQPWLEPLRPGEPYRIEFLGRGDRFCVVSYHFALAPVVSPQRWRVAINDSTEEPAARTLENALRHLTARGAVASGGFALHGASLLHRGKIYILAGGSGAGKTTALSLSRAGLRLGDDFAALIPSEAGWRGAALPFDNRAVASAEAGPGIWPLAGVWRLVQAEHTAIERLPRLGAVAALLGCVPLPGAMPDLVQPLLEQVRRFVEAGGFAQLHFRIDVDFWPSLFGAARD